MKIKCIAQIAAMRHRGKRIQKTPGVNEKDETALSSCRRTKRQAREQKSRRSYPARLRIKINERTVTHTNPQETLKLLARNASRFFVRALGAVCWFGQRLKERPSGPIRSRGLCGQGKKTRGRKTPRKLPSQTVGGRVSVPKGINESSRAELGARSAKSVAKIESGTVAFARETCTARQIENYDEVESRGSASIFIMHVFSSLFPIF